MVTLRLNRMTFIGLPKYNLTYDYFVSYRSWPDIPRASYDIPRASLTYRGHPLSYQSRPGLPMASYDLPRAYFVISKVVWFTKGIIWLTEGILYLTGHLIWLTNDILFLIEVGPAYQWHHMTYQGHTCTSSYRRLSGLPSASYDLPRTYFILAVYFILSKVFCLIEGGLAYREYYLACQGY